jgi:predicted GIY-YIG superfamily endonuclease
MNNSITAADQAAFFASYSGTVYLIHFERPYKHAAHYLGYTDDLAARMTAHRNGTGSRLMQVIAKAGIRWVLVKTWHGGRTLERRLKNYHGSNQLCLVCKGEVSLEQMLREQAPPALRTLGKRAPMGDPRPVHFGGGA